MSMVVEEFHVRSNKTSQNVVVDKVLAEERRCDGLRKVEEEAISSCSQ